MRFFVKSTYLVGMIADQNFYDICFMFFYPSATAMASATAYGGRPKFVMAQHSATADGENCAYSPRLQIWSNTYRNNIFVICKDFV